MYMPGAHKKHLLLEQMLKDFPLQRHLQVYIFLIILYHSCLYPVTVTLLLLREVTIAFEPLIHKGFSVLKGVTKNETL